ncbi:MAG: hypothetical protein H0V17_10050 [Deltaproteobacteria bacterium]|nr:hypothetical protein [Deltaproteobacteria bacterium]
MRVLAFVALAACAPAEDDPEFALLGVVNNVFESGSTIGLFEVRAAEPYTFKFGDGQATPSEFALEFRFEPFDEALDEGGFGVASVGMLPGQSTLPDGEIDPGTLRLIGLSTDTAVIFKRPNATGPAWLADFPDGFACGLCLREQQPDGFAPVDCTFVTIERVVTNRCVW